ncbi:hypothetical protein [Pedobacter sp. MC2016-24]|uniref:hypothetical protein n=1 Tax=Pedobacter sp. MC2016-24 TaxID=2780090 RepID=UPI001D1680F6|nr:hypothetical protein [Pedobacter sp. MC2016-24]
MMKRSFKFSWCLMIGLIGLANQGMAQDVKVAAKLDHTSIPLGDQTNLRLSVHLPTKADVVFPVLGDTISAKVQIVQAGKTDTLADPQNPAFRTISQSYVLTSFEAGLHMVPAFTFKSGGQSFSTNALPLEITAVKIDTTKSIYDIKEPLAVSYSWMDWLRDHWPWVLIPLIVVAALIALWYYLSKRRQQKPVVEAPKPIIPAHVQALDKLKALKDRKLWQQNAVKAYHSELSDIIREYLENRYQVNAMEQTSDEILSGLRHLEISDQSRNSLRQILILADLVKFAKAEPLHTDNEQSMDHAISFITQTKENNPLPENKVQKNNNETA